jgi:hydrogenase/urease accessory protein HupE
MRCVSSPILAIMVFLVALLGSCASPSAHQLQPGYLELRLIDRDIYAVVWKVPVVKARPMAISARLPQNCDPATPPQSIWDGTAYVARWTANCPGGLEDGEIFIEGLEQTSTDVLVRFDFADGVNEARRLTASNPSFTVPTVPSRLEVVRTYFLFGIEHILLGIDHLLFVLALLLLVKGTRRVIATITAFTIAHSITLAGATLGWVHMPGPPVEAIIALSIVFVASEVIHTHRGKPGLTQQYPWIVAFTFGLLHGFGFAGALTEVGLPPESILIALLFFNVGVEAGQMLFVVGLVTAVALLRGFIRLAISHDTWHQHVRPYATLAMGYAIGGVACFWLIERIAAFW